ncbi:lipoprotein [Gemmobacter serpentinus]|uniref:lipoprotein n=1 Tax=Gemmobacter serpentinus TaxID=2652247 RepID=UPI001865717B
MKRPTLAILAVLAVAGCVQSAHSIPFSALKPDPSTGLKIARDTKGPEPLVPSFGVTSDNPKMVLETIAGLQPSDVAPIFARVAAHRKASPPGSVTELPLLAGVAEDMQTVRKASRIICQSFGADLLEVVEVSSKPGSFHRLLLRCN